MGEADPVLARPKEPFSSRKNSQSRATVRDLAHWLSFKVSKKEDTVYQHLDFTRKRECLIPNTEYPDEDDCFTNFKTEFSAIVFDDTLTSNATLSYEPMVSPLNENKIEFRISFDESDDEDYTVIFDENSFSYKIIYVDNLKTNSKNDKDKVDMPPFPSPEPTSEKDNDDDEIDIIQSSRGKGPYTNAKNEKIYDPYLDINRIFGNNYGEKNADDTQDSQEHKKEHEGNKHAESSKPTHDPTICQVRKFEIIKYSFDADDEYVAIKEYEYFDNSRTNINACQAYRELFYIMDEGWLMIRKEE
uniref:Uncharacterized protein n=1 Tax=Tanacetum cinerariifolium TaxID=118510 RepID=A0A699HPH4_TANCI|nr:hypothetical protein [Tanacetum cinerariifolium]